jgi:hypothetical protein
MSRLTDADSSNIARYAYSEKANKLYLEFKSGGCYAYGGITKTEFDKFRAAESLGKYFHANIRNIAPFEKLDGFEDFVTRTGDRSLIVSEPTMWGEIETDSICLL